MTGLPKKYNPARRQAEALASLAQSYLRDRIASDADFVPLRLAAEVLPLDVEVLIRVMEVLPDDIRAGAMNRLANAMVNAAIIGSWHVDAEPEKARKRLAMSTVRRAKDERYERLKAMIRENGWGRGSAAAIHDRVHKAFGRVDGYPGLSTLKRALKDVRNE